MVACGTWASVSLLWVRIMSLRLYIRGILHCLFLAKRLAAGRQPAIAYMLLPCRVHTYFSKELGGSSAWAHNPLGIFCFCAAVTHLGSTATHVYPDSFALVRFSPCPVYQLACHQCKTQLSEMNEAMLQLPCLRKICIEPLLGQWSVQKGPASLSHPTSCWRIKAFLSMV